MVPFSSIPTVFRYESRRYKRTLRISLHPKTISPKPSPLSIPCSIPSTITQHASPHILERSTPLGTAHSKPRPATPICTRVFYLSLNLNSANTNRTQQSLVTPSLTLPCFALLPVYTFSRRREQGRLNRRGDSREGRSRKGSSG
jgi:hypothetical protein